MGSRVAAAGGARSTPEPPGGAGRFDDWAETTERGATTEGGVGATPTVARTQPLSVVSALSSRRPARRREARAWIARRRLRRHAIPRRSSQRALCAQALVQTRSKTRCALSARIRRTPRCAYSAAEGTHSERRAPNAVGSRRFGSDRRYTARVIGSATKFNIERFRGDLHPTGAGTGEIDQG